MNTLLAGRRKTVGIRMVVPREARLPGAREAVLRRALAPRRIWLTSHTMVTDVVVLIADAVRLRAIREALPFPGRILYFNDSNLATALGTIRANEPCRIALDIQFAHSSTGRAFTGKLQSLATKGSEDRKSTRLNSSHQIISYAVFCLKK